MLMQRGADCFNALYVAPVMGDEGQNCYQTQIESRNVVRKVRVRRFLIPLIFLLLSGCGRSADVPNMRRADVLATLGLSPSFDPMEAALRAREWVYVKNNPLPQKASSYSSDDPFAAYVGLKNGTASFLCDGMAFVYRNMLRELGIDARYVVIGDEDYFTSGDTRDTHTTVDVYLDGWVSMDPSFNVTYYCDGIKSSTVDLVACHQQGKSITWSYGGVVYSGRTLEEYYLPFTDLLYGYEL